MILITSNCARVAAFARKAACRGALCDRHRCISGGGRGDLFTRHASAFKPPAFGVLRGLTHSSQTTHPQTGQLRARKLIQHAMHDRTLSGSGHHRTAVATWSYLLPSLRQNVEQAVPDTLYEKLLTDEVPLTPAESRQLADAHRLLRFELQKRIGLLEDSLADAALPYLLQWPALFQRAWLRLPMDQGSASVTDAKRDAVVPAPPSFVHAPAALPITEWAPTLSPASPSACSNGLIGRGALVPRLAQLTRHVIRCVEEDLGRLEHGSEPREDGAPRSRRQVTLEAAWRAQWASLLSWHAGTS
ncbi:hypothetical protein CGC21_38360 [Leishmania donovani]|uniref:Uncharacterized protein n=2 Tax=Leishmania donovani TaxID=5661 RepID=A0A504XZ90_LEIDO|nr:hypothetical protein CGC21_38360 [Leishmania donovani]7AM2_BR Chain BR, mL78 [Leishmania tarentolae]